MQGTGAKMHVHVYTCMHVCTVDIYGANALSCLAYYTLGILTFIRYIARLCTYICVSQNNDLTYRHVPLVCRKQNAVEVHYYEHCIGTMHDVCNTTIMLGGFEVHFSVLSLTQITNVY